MEQRLNFKNIKMKKQTLYQNILKRIAPLATVVVTALLSLGCEEFVDVYQPNSQLTGVTIFEDMTTAEAALTDIYAKMRDMGLLTGKYIGISTLLGVYTDELVTYQTDSFSTEPYFNNNLTVTNGPVQEIWARTYSQIYAANAIIAGVEASSALHQADKDQLIGEALFIRALLHSYMAGIFGGCPYVTTTSYSVNSKVQRLSTIAIYDLCSNDLEQAAELLSASYQSGDRVRPNKFAALALRSRTLLYSGRWAESSNAASAVLNEQGLYIWETDLNKVFLKESTSTIWQIASGGGFTNTQEGTTFIFNAGPPQIVSLRDELYDAFEANDQRRDHWIETVTNGTETWYHAYKYKEQLGTYTHTENSIVLRMAEQYLIRAEARARQGELISALDDLNMVRQRAGLDDFVSSNQSDIIDSVIAERRYEFFTEMGMRFFDLQRTGKLDSVLSPIKPGWNTTDMYWPVPQSEMLINPNLAPQNPGY